MATKREPTQQKYQELTQLWRSVCAVVTGLLAAVSGWYLLWPRQVRTAAPQCGTGNPECTVVVSAPIDGVVLASLLLLTAMFALMTITGVALIPSLDGKTFTPVPRNVEEVTAIPTSATRIVTAAVEDSDVAVEAEAITETITVPIQRPTAKPLILWNTMPEADQRTVLEFAHEHLNLSASEVREGIRELAVDGNGLRDPYYVRLRTGDQDSVLRLS